MQGSNIRVLQAIGPQGRCTHLVECTRTRAVAVVDPWPENADAVRRWTARAERKIRYELHTRPTAAVSDEPDRLDKLRSRIGLQPRRSTPDPPTREVGPWIEVRPLGVEGRELRLKIGGATVTVDEGSGEGPLTVIGPLPRDAAASRVRLALGAFHVEVVPIPGPEPILGYHIADRLLFGGALRTPMRPSPQDPLPGTCLELPPDTLLYSALAPDGIAVSTVGRERAFLRDFLPRTTMGELEPELLESLAGLDTRLTPVPAEERPEGLGRMRQRG